MTRRQVVKNQNRAITARAHVEQAIANLVAAIDELRKDGADQHAIEPYEANLRIECAKLEKMK